MKLRTFYFAALLVLAARGVSAQTATSAFLPTDHWTHGVLRRLDAAGLLPPGSDVARRSIPQEEVAALLQHAAQDDSTGAAAGYLRKFREEFNAPRQQGLTLVEASVRGSYVVESEQVIAGVGYDSVWTGARVLGDEREGQALLRAGFASRHFAGVIASDNEKLLEVQLVATVGAVGAWAGRRAVGYAAGQSNGLVIDNATVAGGGFFLTRPLKAWVLGPARLEFQLSKVDNVLNFNDSEFAIEPWFLSGRVSIEPDPHFRFGFNRALMFGGEGNYPITFSRLFNNLIGFNTANDENAFANQIGSADGRLRIPGLRVPLTLYAEWAVDDLSGGWWDQPGLLVGVELSALPRTDISFGIERTEFKRHETDNAIWYQNPWFRGGWTDGGNALGHPLGGYGKEWRAYSAGGLPMKGITAELAVYRRQRSAQNIFAPERQGRSVGVSGNVDARVNSNVRLIAVGEVEDGDDWTATRARIGVRLGF